VIAYHYKPKSSIKEKAMNNIKVLFHSYGKGKHCPDGFAAAYACWRYWGDRAQYIPCEYQKPAPQIDEGDTVYIVDFSYPRDVLIGMAEIATVRVLDHHKTAQEALLGLNFALFDMTKSGAQLAWEFWFPNTPVPDLISYVGDRDLWLKQLPHTEEVHRALQTFPQDFWVWDTLASLPNYVDFMQRIGTPIYQAHMKAVEELIITADWKELLGHKILCTNTSNYSLVSDALNIICKRNPDTPFAANYRVDRDGRIKFELRSVGEFDVSAIATSLGGGGHLNAAGCAVDPTDERIKMFV
jgi:oligoribonuclease NrnB/cAMP/cGMP phosphodiesterase (DHH superfamily)